MRKAMLMLFPGAAALRMHAPALGAVPSSRVGGSSAPMMTAVGATQPHEPLEVLETCDSIRAPPNDPRQYRWLRASNGLRVFLIHDPATEKAAAALEVHAGHFSDPDERPGLAHFTEHMMFLGTRRYPDEGAFKAFLQKHGGSSNAFTAMETTGYHFVVQENALREALSHFASFFSEPLLREDSCSREMHAVNSEFQRNLQSDARRIFQLIKATASPAHPFRKFSTGNLETLAGVAGAPSPHEAVRGFYEAHYTPDQMCLAVFGRAPLDELQAWVLEQFGALPPPARAVPAAAAAAVPPALGAVGAPLSAAQLGGRLSVQPVRDSRSLRLLWTTPPEPHYAASKATTLLGLLVGHEGEGGLRWLLTRHLQPPLATSVSCSVPYGLTDAAVLSISVALTPAGLARHADVVAHVYGYLHLLASAAAQAADGADAAAAGAAPCPLEVLHRDSAHMAALGFRFAEPSEPLAMVKAAAARLRTTPAEAVLARPFEWADRCEAAAVQELLALLAPRRAALVLVSGGLPVSATERYYGTPYDLAPVPAATLDAWEAARPHPALRLPPANPFLPDDLRLVPHAAAPPAGGGPRAPRRLTPPDAPGLAVWHLDGPGALTPRPRAAVLALLRTPAVAGSARAAVLTTLLVELLDDALSAPLAPAGEAGLGWSVAVHPGGLMLSASGYSQRVPRLALDLAERLRAFEPEPARFAVLREQLERGMRNRRQERPLWHAQYELANALTSQGGAPSVHHAEALAFVGGPGCTVEALAAHLAAVRAALYCEVFAYGNLTPEQARALGGALRDALGGAPLAADGAPLPVGEVRAPRAPLRLATTVANADETNCGLELHLQLGEPTVREEARLLALAQLAAKDAFHELRTVRQLGYVVACGARSVSRSRGLSVHVQSAVMAPPQLEAQVEEWLVGFRAGALAALTPAALAEYAEAVATNLEEPPKRLAEEAAPLWSEVVLQRHRWDYAHRVAAAARELTVDELLAFFDERIAADGPQRRLVVSHAFSPAAAAAAAADAAGAAAAAADAAAGADADAADAADADANGDAKADADADRTEA